MMPPSLTLYFSSTCPYCRKVLDFLEHSGINIECKNVREDPSYRQELLTIGGKTQVPCLIIDGKAKYESDEIIAWLKKNFVTKDDG